MADIVNNMTNPERASTITIETGPRPSDPFTPAPVTPPADEDCAGCGVDRGTRHIDGCPVDAARRELWALEDAKRAPPLLLEHEDRHPDDKPRSPHTAGQAVDLDPREPDGLTPEEEANRRRALRLELRRRLEHQDRALHLRGSLNGWGVYPRSPDLPADYERVTCEMHVDPKRIPFNWFWFVLAYFMGLGMLAGFAEADPNAGGDLVEIFWETLHWWGIV